MNQLELKEYLDFKAVEGIEIISFLFSTIAWG
jgi:hypothetical protein